MEFTGDVGISIRLFAEGGDELSVAPIILSTKTTEHQLQVSVLQFYLGICFFFCKGRGITCGKCFLVGYARGFWNYLGFLFLGFVQSTTGKF